MKNILLLDSNSEDVRLTQEALIEEELAFKLEVIDDGIEALEFLRQEGKYRSALRPDIILMDLDLVSKLGMEVLREIKVDEQLKGIPVIILSTVDEEQEILDCYRMYANCFIAKPNDVQTYTLIVKLLKHFWFHLVKLPKQID